MIDIHGCLTITSISGPVMLCLLRLGLVRLGKVRLPYVHSVNSEPHNFNAQLSQSQHSAADSQQASPANSNVNSTPAHVVTSNA